MLFKTKIDKEDLIKIHKLCKKDVSKDARKVLAGHLDHEYYIEKEKLFEILVKYFDIYINMFKTIKINLWTIVIALYAPVNW
jgi:hypothetical protein